MSDVFDEHAAIAGTASGLQPEQWPGLAHLLRAIARDERDACLKIVRSFRPALAHAGCEIASQVTGTIDVITAQISARSNPND